MQDNMTFVLVIFDAAPKKVDGFELPTPEHYAPPLPDFNAEGGRLFP